MTKGKLFTFLLAGLILISLTFLMLWIDSSSLIYLADEDGLIENLGSIAFLAASVLFFMTFFKVRKSDTYQVDKQLGIWSFVLLGLLFFFVFGEEISWGQRIFGFETPDDVKSVNMQEEFNLHNHALFYAEGRKTALLTPIRLFALFGFVYMLVLPFIVPRIPMLQRLVSTWSIPIPNGTLLGILFMYNLLVCKVIQSGVIVERNRVFRGMGELMEANLAILILLMAIGFYLAPYSLKKRDEPAHAL